MRPISHRLLLRPRGVALIMAISVVAVLTILIMGLAASQQNAAQTRSMQAERHAALASARDGYDCAIGMLKNFVGPLTETREANYVVGRFDCRMEGRPAAPDEPIYHGAFVQFRKGDVHLTITTTTRGVSDSFSMVQEYLVNVNPTQERRLRLSESLGALVVDAP
jgi:hypothetical protein